MTKTVTMAAATAGHAEGGTTLNAFDNALLAAGIGNINLIKVSSILPPEVPVIDLPKIKPGALIPTAYAAMTSETPGETVAAAVGYAVPDDPAKNGVIMEFHGMATKAEAERQIHRCWRRRSGSAARPSGTRRSSPSSTRSSGSAARWPPSRCSPTRTSSRHERGSSPGCVRPRLASSPATGRSADGRIVVFGIPFEGRVNLRKGADAGPRDLRLASDSIETYSPWARARPGGPARWPTSATASCPDGRSPREQLDAAREEIAAWWRPGLIPFMLGGDHTATVPVIEVLAPAFPELRILQLDAHPDTREEFLGERYNYASAMARVMDVVAARARLPGGHAHGRARGVPEPAGPTSSRLLAGHPVDVVRRLLPRAAGAIRST